MGVLEVLLPVSREGSEFTGQARLQEAGRGGWSPALSKGDGVDFERLAEQILADTRLGLTVVEMSAGMKQAPPSGAPVQGDMEQTRNRQDETEAGSSAPWTRPVFQGSPPTPILSARPPGTQRGSESTQTLTSRPGSHRSCLPGFLWEETPTSTCQGEGLESCSVMGPDSLSVPGK